MFRHKLLVGTLAMLCLLALFSMQAQAVGHDGRIVRDAQTGKLRAPTATERDAQRDIAW